LCLKYKIIITPNITPLMLIHILIEIASMYFLVCFSSIWTRFREIMAPREPECYHAVNYGINEQEVTINIFKNSIFYIHLTRAIDYWR
jgi:hypothetical protein